MSYHEPGGQPVVVNLQPQREKRGIARMKVILDGKPVEGERVTFDPIEEPWTKCKLPDGTVIRLKLVVADIVRLRKKQPTGEPHYIVKSSNIMAVDEPDAPGEVH